ncbi:MAG: ATPase [Verrucomicrobia bacterium CG_4_10_14_3_um_filter_43_23]|nr:MAG: ATPase [Verrucomicrobia bacterium CG1_02_43_26]PIP60082.1 MAG: ATPase [Verrucomicrobia bacterium CG22_combo_CG10-13_8_21_14_all_43_17]PIX58671.1 MAG: ATPase [Verrucomicrobia bacterium CG_4_10_14_3_um_filter_43_23]PIY62620.1 MAG: ATPase [Verrucomicrobia bacterium CG_4_10_14_0_8_um_filter_43_34]PJA43307.1 MAG: ATPase [Verrucomicrobia bacterium CG_4_9_14_3_um_filter_43_20]
MNLSEMNEQVKEASAWVTLLRQEIGRVIIGQKYLVDRLIVGLLANGHVLLEGVPGLAKTLSIRTLAQAIQAHFQRIQFTPDLLPADIIGTLIYNPQKAEFFTKRGPIFANIILADEINRAPAKVQSALLEAMQERQVTIGDTTYPLPEPFLVLATENPIDQEGTYPLPEAQVDRFMLKIKIDYPSQEEELKILNTMASTKPDYTINSVVSPQEILRSRKLIDSIYIDNKIKDYIIDIVFTTRDPMRFKLNLANMIQFGASPRATIALTLASKAWAFFHGRAFVTPQDVKNIAMDVLRHRVIISYEAEAEGLTSENIVQKILDTVPVP